jgi:hypothetical protein
MGFDEALARFIQTKPREVDEVIRGSKQKKPPGSKKRRPSGGSSQGVVSLRDKRMRKRNG